MKCFEHSFKIIGFKRTTGGFFSPSTGPVKGVVCDILLGQSLIIA